MAKTNPPTDILESQRIELQNQIVDLEARRQRLSETVNRPMPAWGATASARAIAAAELQDRLHGTANAAAVAASEAEKQKAYGVALAERNDAEAALASVDIHVEVVREELARVTSEIDRLAKAKAEKHFLEARAKLMETAKALRDQAILCGAWAELAAIDVRAADFRFPSFDIECSTEGIPEGFWDTRRYALEFGREELLFAIGNKVMELQAEINS